jgi:hypothetical protein
MSAWNDDRTDEDDSMGGHDDRHVRRDRSAYKFMSSILVILASAAIFAGMFIIYVIINGR